MSCGFENNYCLGFNSRGSVLMYIALGVLSGNFLLNFKEGYMTIVKKVIICILKFESIIVENCEDSISGEVSSIILLFR